MTEPNNNDNLYEKLVDVDRLLDFYETQKKILTEQIIKKFQAEKIDRAENRGMVIRMVDKVTWKYSPAVALQADSLKQLKKNEELMGTATKSITPYLRLMLRDK